jgi:hypothetical protein
MRRPFSTTHRFPLVFHNAKGASGSGSGPRRTLAVLGILLVGGVSVAVPLSPHVHFVLAGAALLMLAFVAARHRRPSQTSGVALVADAMGLSRVSPEGALPIVRFNAPFGVTMLASYGRPHALLAFTTPTETRYIPTRIDGRSEADDALFAGISVLADLDLVDDVTHSAALGPSDAAAVVRHAEEHDRAALGRIYLSDGRGAPIQLDRATLSVATRSFDLTSHLEWRPLMFHESTGQAAALYQATWIRQRGAEVVLVAPMPASIVPLEPNARQEATGRLGRALTRDLRLLQSPAEPPPSRDVRVAIDRPFMMAVRRALDEAPLASRVSLPLPKEPRAEGRDSIV